MTSRKMTTTSEFGKARWELSKKSVSGSESVKEREIA